MTPVLIELFCHQQMGAWHMDVQFGDYWIKRAERLLLGPMGPVELSGRSFDILAMLLAKPDSVVGKNEILDTVWPGLVVEENTLQVHISALRKALDAGMIMTVHGRGYKYAGPRPIAAGAEAPVPAKPSIAVLPFANLSGDAAQDIFCEGLALNIVASLGRFHELFVIDRFSTLAYRNRPVTSAEAARELSVRYILEGSVQKSGDRIRVSVQLVDGAENRQLWTETYDRQLNDIFAVQDEITGTIIGTLASGYGGRLGRAWRERGKSTGSKSFVALDYLQKALDNFDFTKEGMIRVRKHLTKAIECDPGFAKAYSKMAFAYLVDASYGWAEDHDAALEKARQWAVKAIASDDSDSWAHWAFAGYQMYTSNHGVAFEAYRKALDCNPNDAEVTAAYGLCLSYAGRAEEGIEQALKAMRLNPHHHDWYKSQLGQIYFDARQYDKTIATFASLRSLDSALMRVYQAASFAAAGNQQQAQKSVKRVLELDAGATLEKWTDPKLAPYGDAAYLEHFRQNLRKAGLPEQAAPQDERPSIAILPFDNMSGDPEQRYFSDGITEDIITAVSRFPSLFVVAQASSFSFREHNLPASELARQLGVAYVLEGSVRKEANRVRITAQLIEAASGKHIWSERYDRGLEDIFAVQDEVARVIAWRLTAQVESDIVAHPPGQHPENFAAYDFMLRGMQLQQRNTRQDVAAAIPLFERAIECDPAYGEAHSLVGLCHLIFHIYDLDSIALERAWEFAQRGIRLDERNARCQVIAGYCAIYRGRFDEAEFHHERAASINPNEAHVAMHMGLFHAYAGQPENSGSWFETGRLLNPFPPVYYAEFERIARYGLGLYEDAARPAQGTWDDIFDQIYITASLGQLGRIAEAKVTLDRCKQLVPAGLTIRAYVAAEPYRHHAGIAHLLDGLRKAGFTE